jgi:hypothetical protein
VLNTVLFHGSYVHAIVMKERACEGETGCGEKDAGEKNA